MKRVENWEKELANFLEKRQNMPFKWGQNDCVIFPHRAAQAITGYNYVSDNNSCGRGYRTRAAATKVLKEHFNKKIENVFTHYFGEPREDIGFARRGDIVLFKNGRNLVGGVIDNTGRYIASAGPNGIARHPKKLALKYWRVGGE